jgi:hypothetical protein
MRDLSLQTRLASSEITNESNFISLVGNDSITIYDGKNRYKHHYPSGKKPRTIGRDSRPSFRDTQTGTAKAKPIS